MKKIKVLIIFSILISMFGASAEASIWKRSLELGNSIQKEEYPDGKDVEPIKPAVESETTVIQGGVQEYIDISLEDCLRIALGNNPRILLFIDFKFSPFLSK